MNNMTWKPNEATTRRVIHALNMMARNQWGIERASKNAGTTRRSVHRYAKHMGIPLKGKEGQTLRAILQPDKKVTHFLRLMTAGNSASASARKLKTTVRAMSKQKYLGQPIIVKEGNRWVAQWKPVVKVEGLGYFMWIINFNDNILGRGKVIGPDAHKPKNKKKMEANYAEISAEFNIDTFDTTLAPEKVGQFYLPAVMDFLKKEVEKLGITDAPMMRDFEQNAKVRQEMVADKRFGTNKISIIEQLVGRYGVRLEETGVVDALDTDFRPEPAVDFIPVKGYTGKALDREATGEFKIHFLENMIKTTYGPVKLTFKYSLAGEE